MSWGYNETEIENGGQYRQVQLNPSTVAVLTPGPTGDIDVGMGFAVEQQQVPTPGNAPPWTDQDWDVYNDLYSQAVRTRTQNGPESVEYQAAYDQLRLHLANFPPDQHGELVQLTGQNAIVPFPLNGVTANELLGLGLTTDAFTNVMTYAPTSMPAPEGFTWPQIPQDPSLPPSNENYQTKTVYAWKAKNLPFNLVDLGAKAFISTTFYVPLGPQFSEPSLTGQSYSMRVKIQYDKALHGLTPGDINSANITNLQQFELENGPLVSPTIPANVGAPQNQGSIYCAVHPIRYGFPTLSSGVASTRETGGVNDVRHPEQLSSEFRLETTLSPLLTMRQSLFKHASPDSGSSNLISSQGYPVHFFPRGDTIEYFWNDGKGDPNYTRKYYFTAGRSASLLLYKPDESDYNLDIGPIRALIGGEATVARIDVDEDTVTMNYAGATGAHAYHQARSSHLVNDNTIAGASNSNPIHDGHQCELLPITVGWLVRDLVNTTLPPFKVRVEYD